MAMTVETKEDAIRRIIEELPEGYELYAAVGALVSIAHVLDDDSVPTTEVGP